MKYKLLGFILVILIATPVFGQEVSPIIVDTLQPTPTTVITGQFFVQTYRVTFLDLAEEGLELTVNEDNLNVSQMGDFEVLDFCIDKGEPDGPCAGLGGGSVRKDLLQRTWYLKYTLRIVNPKKGTHKIPPITVYWTEKKIGQTATQAETRKFESEGEVFVNYVTTITEDPNVQPRDGIDFGNFAYRALVYQTSFWFFSAFIPVLWLIWFVAYLRSPAVEPKASTLAGISAKDNLPDNILYESPNKRQAFLALKRNIDRFAVMASVDSEKFDGSKIRGELAGSLMDFLRNWVPESTVGTTPNQMAELAKKVSTNTSNGFAILVFAEKTEKYQYELEKGVESNYWHTDPSDDVVLLRNNLANFKWYLRPWNYLRYKLLKFLMRLGLGR